MATFKMKNSNVYDTYKNQSSISWMLYYTSDKLPNYKFIKCTNVVDIVTVVRLQGFSCLHHNCILFINTYMYLTVFVEILESSLVKSKSHDQCLIQFINTRYTSTNFF